MFQKKPQKLGLNKILKFIDFRIENNVRSEIEVLL